MTHAQILPASQVAEIAAQFGFEPDDPDVVEEAEAARKAHGRESPGYDGDARRYWHVDPHTRRVDAALLLAGHLEEQARVRDADCGSIQAFHDAAYGDD